MNIFRILSLFAVAAATACTTLQQQNSASIPREELASLLTSQGLLQPWQVDVHGNGNPQDGEVVYVREGLRQLGPNICVTHRHDLFLERSAAGYRIASADTTQEVALIECARARPADFAPIVTPNGDLPDNNLRRLIAALPTLQRIAEAGQGSVQFHYERQELREMLTQRSGREIFQIIAYTPESITVTLNAGPYDAVNRSFSFDGDRLGEHAYVTSSVLVSSGSPIK